MFLKNGGQIINLDHCISAHFVSLNNKQAPFGIEFWLDKKAQLKTVFTFKTEKEREFWFGLVVGNLRINQELIDVNLEAGQVENGK